MCCGSRVAQQLGEASRPTGLGCGGQPEMASSPAEPTRSDREETGRIFVQAFEKENVCAVALGRMACVNTTWRHEVSVLANQKRQIALSRARESLPPGYPSSLSDLRSAALGHKKRTKPLLQAEVVALAHLAEADASLRSLETHAHCADVGTSALAAATRRGAFELLSLGGVHREGALALGHALSYGPHPLRSLRLDQCFHMGENGVAAIGRALKDCAFETLSLQQAAVTPEACVGIAEGLHENKYLRTLNMRHNPLSDNGVLELCKGIGRQASKSRLQSIKLSWAHPLLSQRAALALAKMAERCSSLEQLELEHVFDESTGPLAIRRFALRLPRTSLKTLELSTNTIDGDAAFALGYGIALLPSIRNLHIDSCSFGNNEADLLAEGCWRASCVSLGLHSLSIKAGRRHNMLTDGSSVRSLGSVLSGIRSLDLSGNRIGSEGAQVLSEVLHSHPIDRLNLSSCSIGDKGARALRSMQIKELKLAENLIREQGGKELGYRLPQEALDLSGNAVRNEGAAAIAEGLRHGKCTHIVLDLNSISSDGIESVVRALRVRWNAHVDMSGNETDSKLKKRLNISESLLKRIRL